MKIVNELPKLLECLKTWPTTPTRADYDQMYGKPLEPWLKPMLEDFWARFSGGPYETLKALDWAAYRKVAIALDPASEEARLRRQMEGVEKLLGFQLEGEAVLFGSFTMMDGYARFDRGKHRVFLGCDESHHEGKYLDVLYSHELTHVIRESRPAVWEGWGLSPKMTHDEFVENLPVVEHLANEGFSCVVSEILNPGERPWSYAYQTEASLQSILENTKSVDRAIHAELKKSLKDGDYAFLYDVTRYQPVVPRFAHYVWAWQWVKSEVRARGNGDMKEGARKFVGTCSKEMVESALAFELPINL